MSGDKDNNEMIGNQRDAQPVEPDQQTSKTEIARKFAAYHAQADNDAAAISPRPTMLPPGITEEDIAKQSATQEFAAVLRSLGKDGDSAAISPVPSILPEGITEEDVAKQSATQEFAAVLRARFSNESPSTEPKPAKRKSLLAALAAVPAVLIAIFTAIGLPHGGQPVLLAGTIEAKEITLAPKVTGRVSKVLVEEGQIVKAGQALIDISLAVLEAQRHKQQAEIELREARLLELKNGARSAERARARAVADESYLNWKMLKDGYRSEDIAMAGAQRQECERQLALLEKGYRFEEVDQAKAQMEEKNIHLQWAERDFQRYQQLSADGAVSSREADEMRTKRDEAKSALEAATKNYAKFRVGPRVDEILAARERLKYAQQREHMLLAGPRAEQIGMAWQQYLQAKAAVDLLSEGTRFEQVAQSQAALTQAKATLAELDAQLEDKTICSPADAEVSVLDLHKGQILAANKPVVKLTRLDNMWIRLYIPENQLSRVYVGQQVDLKADSYPGKIFHGKIVQIPSTAEFTPRNIQTAEERSSQVFGLKVSIDNRQRQLRGGMNAEIVLPAVAPAPSAHRGIALWPQY